MRSKIEGKFRFGRFLLSYSACLCVRVPSVVLLCVCVCAFFLAFILKHYSIHPRTRNVSIFVLHWYCTILLFWYNNTLCFDIRFLSLFFFFIDFSSLILFHFILFWFNTFCFDIRAVLHFFG